MGKIVLLQLFIVLVVTLNYCLSWSLPKPIEPFMSGEKMLDAIKADTDHRFAGMINGEFGQHVRVPLDYNDPSAGTIGIYYFTLGKEFNPSWPTMLYFQGGPGGGSHGVPAFNSLDHWNVVFIEYRGMALSYPDQKETIMQSKYFTSENVARDASEIVKALGVEKVSVFGSSYGTLTATIFASLFPHQVRSVILEGIIYKGDEYLWSSSHRQKILQRHFNNMPTDLQDLVLKYSNMPGVNPAWFSRLGQSAMYSDSFSELLTLTVQETLTGPEEQVKEYLAKDEDDIFNSDDMFFFSPLFFLHIACKELSGFADYATFNFVFEGRKLVPVKQTVVKNACTEMNIEPSLLKNYDARDYKISVPVFYVQGTFDGATTAPTGIWHYKNVPQSRAQLFLVKGGGHGPFISKLDSAPYLNLLKLMLDGTQIPKDIFDTNYKKDFPDWVTTLK